MADPGTPFPTRGRDDFDDWLRSPVPPAPSDPQIEVRRAEPHEFERIYDLLDDVFGFKRPRALYDWVYRHNPGGLARCWISLERATGAVVGCAVNWPWPLARGDLALPGALGGDAAVARRWQRQRIHEHAGNIRESHPWNRSVVNFGWPNPLSVRRIRKLDRSRRLIGELSRRVLPLHTTGYLAGRGVPRPLASAAGRVVDGLFSGWSRTVLSRPRNGRVEEVRRFDAAFDDVTRRSMSFAGYWSPHDCEFLNWRYRSDPVREHVAFASTIDGALAGYAVARVHAGKASLMELVAPAEPPWVARALLLRVVEVAIEAGCSHLMVVAPAAWRHWRLFAIAGFMAVAGGPFLYAFSWRGDTPGLDALENWRLFGGDLDPFAG